MPLRRVLIICALLGVLIFALLRWRNLATQRQSGDAPGTTILKQPVVFANRTFDPANPPAEMPPLTPGENAECDSNFVSNANVAGQIRPTDDSHATLTVTKVTVTLHLDIAIWMPVGVAQHVIEHEEGHRHISEAYYETADKLAERIASSYLGKQIEITGTNLNAESSQALERMAEEITGEYSKELDPGPTQLLYDRITDHSRNGVVAQDAVTHALKNTLVESTQPAASLGN